MRLTTLDNIVRDVCIVSLQNASLSQYPRVARAVRSGIMQVNLNYSPSIKTQLITIGANMTAPLPADCVVVTKVGVLCTDGRIMTLVSDSNLRSDAYDKSIQEPLYCECEQPPATVLTLPAGLSEYYTFYNCYWGGSVYGELYGVSNSVPSLNYRVNKQFHVLEFSSGWVDAGFKVLVEYKSDGAGEFQMIPIEAAPAIKAYALYELHKNDPKYMYEFRRLADQMNTLHSESDILAVITALLGGQTSSPG
jgi:hypothetical protein